MRIERVELKNIKPFVERSFDFADGVNVLCGMNGAGKSTVFEAIGYALFGVQPQAFLWFQTLMSAPFAARKSINFGQF